MKNKILIFLLTFMCLLFLSSFHIYKHTHQFDYSSVIKNINYISSDTFKGRLPGTIENDQIAHYIKNDFKDTGLKPFNKSYFQYFNTKCPVKVQGNPYLEVGDKNNNVIKKYIYGKDFKEDMLNFRNNKVSFSKENSKLHEDEYLVVDSNGSNFLFYSLNKNELGFRSSFIEDAPFDMYIMLSKKTFNDIKKYLDNNYSISCYIPYIAKEKKLYNVIGYIPGINKNASPIIVSAHFDHIGMDLNNTIYNGALDNASGISFIMEMSKYIHSLGKPYRSILFIGFNAEEFGCIGSKYFVDKYKTILKDSIVYNFDMIGTNNSIPLYIVGGKNDTDKTPLIHSVSYLCSKEKIPFNYVFSDSSDHSSFRNENIKAITFCDNDLSRIHTPNDKAYFISQKPIERCYKVASHEIVKSAFLFSTLYLHCKIIMIISLIFIIILVIMLVYFKKQDTSK
ncbi:aminopeptidase YwaD precursor [Clostridium tepidiprofundi DSM 19306]|uniref:Aminopeptidase YwaD n=1 Tax=Clostridium tepidiprofundi DSM 19306 TaxID=1121338 RepID=A0A151AXP0_9CLOT|nr:M28 family metallopeptidase [Clostridium tepidiprofundi]KYH32429.1 aminopeptidase YwaD precursor [Clostridium tepidiprofundi DSM 19306]